MRIHVVFYNLLLIVRRSSEVSKGLVVGDGQVKVQIHEDKYILRWSIENIPFVLFISIDLGSSLIIKIDKCMGEDLGFDFFLGSLLKVFFILSSIIFLLHKLSPLKLSQLHNLFPLVLVFLQS